MGAAALETFSTNTLQDPTQAAAVWDTNGGSVTIDSVTPVTDEPVPAPPAICAPGAGECRDLRAQGSSAPTCSCPQTATDFRPNCLETGTPPWAPTSQAGTCVVGGDAAAPACRKLVHCGRVPAGHPLAQAAGPATLLQHPARSFTCLQNLCGGLYQAVENCNSNWWDGAVLGCSWRRRGGDGSRSPHHNPATLPPPNLGVCSALLHVLALFTPLVQRLPLCQFRLPG